MDVGFFGLGTKKSFDPSCFFPFFAQLPSPQGARMGVFWEHVYSVTKLRLIPSLFFWY